MILFSLRAKIEVLMKSYEGCGAAKGTSESELNKRYYCTDLLIGSFDVDDPHMGGFGSNFDQGLLGGNTCSNRLEVPGNLLQNSSHYKKKDERSKRHSTRFQLPKLSRENGNRYACLAHPEIEESYASAVKKQISVVDSP